MTNIADGDVSVFVVDGVEHSPLRITRAE